MSSHISFMSQSLTFSTSSHLHTPKQIRVENALGPLMSIPFLSPFQRIVCLTISQQNSKAQKIAKKNQGAQKIKDQSEETYFKDEALVCKGPSNFQLNWVNTSHPILLRWKSFRNPSKELNWRQEKIHSVMIQTFHHTRGKHYDPKSDDIEDWAINCTKHCHDPPKPQADAKEALYLLHWKCQLRHWESLKMIPIPMWKVKIWIWIFEPFVDGEA